MIPIAPSRLILNLKEKRLTIRYYIRSILATSFMLVERGALISLGMQSMIFKTVRYTEHQLKRKAI